MPLKDGIVELRQKGASLRLIRELLATVGVAVSTDTIARFLAEVNGDHAPQRPPKRSPRRRAGRRNSDQRANRIRSSVRTVTAVNTARRRARNRQPSAHAHADRAIADPRNL